MENPISHLKSKISELTESQRKVADYILKNQVEVAFLTVDQLASMVGTSTTTIMRLTYSLGYSGYTEFQKGLQEMLRHRADPNTRLTASLKEIDDSDLWLRCVDNAISNIRSTSQAVTSETMDDVRKTILQAGQIYCTAVRSAIPVAQSLSYGLSRLLGKGELMIADHGNWTEKVIDFTSSDLVIAISFPRYARSVLEFVKAAKENRAQVVSITDSYSSPLVKYSDYILPCSAGSISFHNSMIAPMLAADFLISAVAMADPERTKQRLKKIDSLMVGMHYHVLNLKG